MIVENELSSSHRHDDTLIAREKVNELEFIDIKTNNNMNIKKKSSVFPEQGSHYSRCIKSMLEESDDEACTGEVKEDLRKNTLVDWDDIHQDEEDDGDRDRDDVEVPRSDLNHPSSSTIDSSNYCGHGPFPTLATCHMEFPLLPGCQVQSLAEQLDMMTCRHPLDLFSVFQDNNHHHHHHLGNEPSERLLPGMHFIPRSCEYCGAEDTDYCMEDCQRPKSFFYKKRPPLCPVDATRWDPKTDIAIPVEETMTTSTTEPIVMERRRSLLLRNFFR